MQPIFKVGDNVFWYRKGWGKITNIKNDENPIVVDFNGLLRTFTIDGKYHVNDPSPTLSFTEYNFITGGFSQVRPRLDLKEGELIWVRNDGEEWLYKRFYAWTDKGVYVTNQYNMLQYKYTQYSVECPVK